MDKGLIQIPTLKWASNIGAPPYSGGTRARANVSSGLNELCALNYQRTGYVNSNDGGEFTCRPGGSPCPSTGHCAYGSDCGSDKLGGTQNTYFAWRFMDINGDRRPDLVGSPMQGGLQSYDLIWGSGVANDFGGAPQEKDVGGNIFGTFEPCPSQRTPVEQSYTAKPNDPRSPYTMCGGMFPYFVYYNNGNGSFGLPRNLVPGELNHQKWGPLPNRILYQPIPLESTTGDSSLLAAPVGADQGSTDIDGDGYIDGVYRGPQDNGVAWSVYLNDGSGQYKSTSNGTPWPYLAWSFGIVPGYFLNKSTVDSSFNAVGVEGLTDLNGDGLADHWKSGCTTCVSQFAWSDGIQFRAPSGVPEQITTKVGVDSYTYNLLTTNGWVRQGVRVDQRRELDIDHDGRVDLLAWAPPIQQPFTRFNQGGDFGDAAGVLGWATALNHAIVASENQLPYYFADWQEPNYAWEIRSDAIDLDGDGIAEEVSFSDQIVNPMVMDVAQPTSATHPPRLLASINNNRGAVTSIAYASMNSATVEQRPDLDRRMPQTQWVVQSLTTVDSIASTTTTTSYQYKRPVFSRDDRKQYGFRGFEEVTTTRPSGASTSELFSYSTDWTGRLVKTVVKPAATDMPTPVVDEVRSIDETTWEERQLFGGLLKTYHATIVDHWTCKIGQTETACRTNTDTRKRNHATLSSLTSTSGPDLLTPLMWQVSVTRLQDGESETPAGPAVTGTRRTTTTFALAADATTYRLRPTGTTREELRNSGYETHAKTATLWDSSYRVATDEDVWFSDPGDACTPNAPHCARTHFVYDMNTGNVLERWKPKQYSAGNGKLTYNYDARKLFPIKETTEPAGYSSQPLIYDYTYEYGTGIKLVTSGPNDAACAPSNCPVGTALRQETRLRVDGLGRTIERWETVSDDGSSYPLYKLAKNTYVDTMPSGTTPISVTRETALNVNGVGDVSYRKETTEIDGHGRPRRTIIDVAGPLDAVTTYIYRDDGTLAEVRVPDPRANDASTVSYLYASDSLGRAIGIKRPDAVDPLDRSGVQISYDGLSQTTDEILGSHTGEAASTITRNDSFGRLREVREKRLAPSSWSVTLYDHDAADRVTKITDAENGVTELQHDFAGRRTKITRASRSWSYGYDKNDNMVFVKTPCTPVPTCEPAHTTTIAYDNLDRPASKLIAPRDLSLADRTLFGVDRETYQWDYVGGNRKGVLRQWTTYAPNTTTGYAGSILYWYNAQGQTTSTQQTLGLDGVSLTRSFYRNYYLSGAERRRIYYDAIGGSNGSESTITYDERGLPRDVFVNVKPRPYQTIATQTRNVAGLVTKRRSNQSGAMTYIESTWTYDELGRVVDHAVQKGPGPEQVVRQALDYHGNDDPRQLDHWLGPTNLKQFEFAYTPHHQLATVSEASNAFSASYNYRASGRFDTATEAALALPGSDVKPRDVAYVYDSTDPERVTALQQGGSTYASYTYDEAGNQTSRTYPATGESWEYVYDGKEQLRRVTKKLAGVTQGSEEYWYDGNNKRVAIVKRDASGTKTEIVYFLDDIEAHYSGTGTLTHIYSYITMGGTPVARIKRTDNTTTEWEYMFHGLADNTLAAVDRDTGTINASFVYAPFGEIIEATDAGGSNSGLDKQRRRMNDKYVDEVSGLAYYGFRYYDKMSMSWTQSDPLFSFAPDLAMLSSPRRANRYAFALQNALRYLDPDGRDSRDTTACKDGGTCTSANSNVTESEKKYDSEEAADTIEAEEGGQDLVEPDSAPQIGDVATPIAVGLAIGGPLGGLIGGVLSLGVNGVPSAMEVATGCIVGAGCAKACSTCSKSRAAVRAGTSTLRKASRAANKAAKNSHKFQVGKKHLAGAGGKWAKFAEGVDPNAALREALSSPNARFLPNDGSSFRVISDLGRAVGTRGETGVRAVVRWDGRVVTWFPVRQ